MSHRPRNRARERTKGASLYRGLSYAPCASRRGVRGLTRDGVGCGLCNAGKARVLEFGNASLQPRLLERYAIVSRNDIADAMLKLQHSEKVNDPQNGHVIGHK